MAKKSKPRVKARGLPKSNPGLGQAKAHILNKQSGERIMAMSELDQLEDKRRGLAQELEEIDGQILGYKKKRRDELVAELKALGLNDMPRVGGDGKRKGRPKGFKMTDAQKKAMREGRERTRAAKAAGTSVQ